MRQFAIGLGSILVAVGFLAFNGTRAAADTLCWSAAEDPGAVFNGLMTTGTEYADGNDLDPSADSFFSTLVYSQGTTTETSGNTETVTYTVDIPFSGDWHLWARFYYPGTPGSNDANSFFVEVDAGAALSARQFGNNKDFFQEFHWDGNGFGEHGTTSPTVIPNLSAGTHTITIKQREVLPVAPRIDAFCLESESTVVMTDAIAVNVLFPSCTPQTCQDLSVECGMIDDGCGTILDCGGCTGGDTCNGNVCECTPMTCQDLGAECGMIDDGCGTTLDCGSCTGGDSCMSNVCVPPVCTPMTCQDLGAECGMIGDGCGATLDCGSCTGDDSCMSNVCVPPICTPLTCEDLGAECGSIDDGCGMSLDCGACDSLETCSANLCEPLGPESGVNTIEGVSCVLRPLAPDTQKTYWFALALVTVLWGRRQRLKP